MAKNSMLHVRIDDDLKREASDVLEAVGLTVSDAVRILLTRVRLERGLPAGLATESEAYDAWFREKVRKSMEDPAPSIAHDDVMAEAQAIIDRKRRESA